MPAISNDYARCEMLNLGSGPGGRGPFAIRQEGSAPGSMTLQQERFLLRHDGVWVLNLTVLSMTEKEQEKFLYPTSTEVMQALEKLTGDPVVDDRLPEGKSKAEVLAGIESSSSRILSGLRNARPAPMS
jgi:hypothetical protein